MFGEWQSKMKEFVRQFTDILGESGIHQRYQEHCFFREIPKGRSPNEAVFDLIKGLSNPIFPPKPDPPYYSKNIVIISNPQFKERD